MIIPPDQLEPNTLKAIIEQYVLGEGTEYGSRDYSLEEKVASVTKQIESGEVVIVWSQAHETINLLPLSETKLNQP